MSKIPKFLAVAVKCSYCGTVHTLKDTDRVQVYTNISNGGGPFIRLFCHKCKKYYYISATKSYMQTEQSKNG